VASASTRASRSRSKERQKHRGERQHPRHDRRNLVNRRGHEVPSVTTLVEELAPSLVGICGCGPLTAAKIPGETADVRRFRSNDAYARHNGTAPLPVWSSNRARHRLSRRGNSTPPSTGLRSRKRTTTPAPALSSLADEQTATAASKPSES